MLELLGLGHDVDAAAVLAGRVGGLAYANHPGEHDKRPYSAVIRVATDDIEAVRDVADVALHVAFARVIKAPSGPPTAGRAVASFGLLHHPDLTHRQADDHWRDTHGPLALACHSAMCDYTQLSIVATLSGQELDGMALCAFDSREDVSTKFFNDDEAKAAIMADVATFANAKGSPARVVLNQIV